MKFYLKHGFITYSENKFPLSGTNTLTLYSMIKYLTQKIIKNVTVVGGTHGNERIGVELVSNTLKHELKSKYSTLDVNLLIGNDKAVELNQRFVDVDLNRQFVTTSLSNEQSQLNDSYEYNRAIELNNSLGPKQDAINSKSDFIIDLHSSESNVGIVAMISGEVDCLAFRVASHLKNNFEKFKDLKITCSPGTSIKK